MIAHVAAAYEDSGRVVLWLDPESKCSPTLLDAPVRLAAAFDADIETIIVDQEPDDRGGVPVRRVRSIAGSSEEAVVISRRFQLLAERCRRLTESVGAIHRVNIRHRNAHGDAIDRISEMCAVIGPWNIVALARMPALGGHSVIGSLLANVSGATGFLLCGDKPADDIPHVVVIFEDVDRLPSMLRAAERLSGAAGVIHVLIGAETSVDYAEIEAQARLMAVASDRVVFETAGPTFGIPGALTEAIARLKPSFVVARFGGSALADGRELARASASTRAPILLVR
ncbi:hypothetical protein DLM45_09510 [Hyphomicrobium methylovorum]|uniref:hypothetical protein n=1 Tax=Hyphomicrobium methylovorum TaxID=84 RepID=UPI0015E6A548|nr:hypothetical protein [Hyphomicrobium methylovorum]MBA2126455.1 hypothetical protein [Hyphomicrobium methylovorum]